MALIFKCFSCEDKISEGPPKAWTIFSNFSAASPFDITLLIFSRAASLESFCDIIKIEAINSYVIFSSLVSFSWFFRKLIHSDISKIWPALFPKT